MKSVSAQVVIDAGASADEIREVEAAFRSAGVGATVRAAYQRKGVADFSWIVLATLPLTAFFTALASEAGRDAYRALRQFVRNVFSARQHSPQPQGSLLARDTETCIEILLEPDLPDKAYRELLQLDLSAFELGSVKYDRDKGEWRALVQG